MNRLVSGAPFMGGVVEDEKRAAAIIASLLAPWEKAWRAGDSAAYKRLWTGGPGLRAGKDLAWAGSAIAPLRERDGIAEFEWRLESGKEPGAESAAYLGRFSRIDDFRLELWSARPVPGGVRIEVSFDLRGQTQDGRRQDRGRLDAVAREEGGVWRLIRIEPARLESLRAKETVFVDATAAWGLDRVPVIDRREAIRRGGYALAVADYDGDSRPDALIGGYGPVALYRNAGGRFEDVTAAAGLKGETLVKSAAFADLDNDGRRDLLLLRFVEDGKDKDGDLVAYRNTGAGFERKAEVLTRTRKYDRTMPLTVADFDGDGRLDLYLGFPGIRDFTTPNEEPQKLAPQGIWLNDGKWGFREVPQESGIWESDRLFPHSASATDLDRDGRADIVVIDDRGNMSRVYHNEGGGMFRQVAQQAGLVDASWAMSAAAGDYDGDGYPDLYLTSIDFLAARRILATARGRATRAGEAEALAHLARIVPGNRLFHNLGDGTFEEVTQKAGVGWAGEASAGAEWIDFNGDGHLDLYVTNGLWSGGEHDVSSLFVQLNVYRRQTQSRAGAPAEAGGWAAKAADIALIGPLAQDFPEYEGPNLFLKILREFRGDPARPDGGERAASPTLSMAGYQRNRLFRNNGDGSFTELGYLAGADLIEDGYVPAAADFDGDGRQDLLVRNCDPAPGRSFPTVSLLRNAGPGQKSLTVFLKGSQSNADGIGAIVTARVGSRSLTRELRATAGASQGEPSAFFGLGAQSAVSALEVLWPSGRKELFRDLRPGRVRIEEGGGIRVLASL